jgi:hypothetical protein|tara:strand:- start:1095 stop:1484 length:390 start_codon:yes stop_codon:yes gene_type:complete
MARRKKTETREEATEPVIRTFRLLRGGHIENSPSGVGRTYKKGDIFESISDLLRFNQGPNSRKFEEIGSVAPALPTSSPEAPSNVDTVTSYTVDELKIIADDEEIDISDCTSKEEIEERIKEAAQSQRV